MIHPDVVKSCQLVMGMTELAEGNIWNTMPATCMTGRSEVYLYFGLPADARVVHLMGKRRRRAIGGGGRSGHHLASVVHPFGVGTRAYTFIWGMGGEISIIRTWTWWPGPVAGERDDLSF